MAHATDIVGYTYRADVYCPRCIGYKFPSRNVLFAGEPSEVYLDRVAGYRVINRQDESTFDSSEFPKVRRRAQVRTEVVSHDWPGRVDRWSDRCGSCGEVLGA